MAITPGSHGSTPYQKRYWRVVSEYVRKRDFEKYGTCVSCGAHFDDWRAGHAGHYIPWSRCNAWFKYDWRNLALQCARCNLSLHRSGADVGHAFAEELKRRYGDDILTILAHDNESLRGQKMEVPDIVFRAEKLYEKN